MNTFRIKFHMVALCIFVLLLISYFIYQIYSFMDMVNRSFPTNYNWRTTSTPNRQLEEFRESFNRNETAPIYQLYKAIRKREFKKYSQNNEDGAIKAILKFLNMQQTRGFYVEFGVENGNECNTRYLREFSKWTGLMFDSQYENWNINLFKEVITHDNVLEIFSKYRVPEEFDLLSEDTDYADYWILEKILSQYDPKIVVHEVNQELPDLCVTVPKPANVTYWEELSRFHGASVCAFQCLAKRFEYTMVYCESVGVNCFWIRNDLLVKHLDVEIELVRKVLSPQFLFNKPKFVYREPNKQWHYVTC